MANEPAVQNPEQPIVASQTGAEPANSNAGQTTTIIAEAVPFSVRILEMRLLTNHAVAPNESAVVLICDPKNRTQPNLGGVNSYGKPVQPGVYVLRQADVDRLCRGAGVANAFVLSTLIRAANGTAKYEGTMEHRKAGMVWVNKSGGTGTVQKDHTATLNTSITLPAAINNVMMSTALDASTKFLVASYSKPSANAYALPDANPSDSDDPING